MLYVVAQHAVRGREGYLLIVLITMTLVAANTSAMSVRERRREVAIMPAIGFARRQVVAMLIGESLTIALIGGIVGCLAAYTML